MAVKTLILLIGSSCYMPKIVCVKPFNGCGYLFFFRLNNRNEKA